MEALRYHKEILEDIKEKKELKCLDDQIIAEKMEKVFLQEPKLYKQVKEKEKTNTFKEFSKSKPYTELIKKTRLMLREIYGVFILKGYEKKEALLQHQNLDTINTLLELHQSSKERIPYYKEIYKQIFERTGKPQSILDLGCGLNPCSYFFLGFTPHYFASDLNQRDCDFLNAFFKTYKIEGKAFPLDLTKENQYPKADVCFLLKVVDSMETTKKNSTRLLLKALDCHWIIASFPQVSLGQKKKIPTSKRQWFFTMLTYEGYAYTTFEVPNELFVLIKKKK